MSVLVNMALTRRRRIEETNETKELKTKAKKKTNEAHECKLQRRAERERRRVIEKKDACVYLLYIYYFKICFVLFLKSVLVDGVILQKKKRKTQKAKR